MRVLGLDISSSTIGWAVLENDGDNIELLSYGHIKPPPKRKGSLSFRLNFAFNEITNLLARENPDVVAVEDYARKFSKGKSRANTIIVLSVFNEVSCLAAYRFLSGQDVYSYSVSTIRSVIGKYLNKKIVSKEEIFPVINEEFENFEPAINRVGNIQKEAGDQADAIAVALAHILKVKEV